MASTGIAISLAIGDRIYNRRKELGLTLQILADISGLSASFISQAERNKTVPSIISLITLAKALGVSVEYFTEALSSPDPIHRADHPEYIENDLPVTIIQLGNKMEFGQKLDTIMIIIPAGETVPLVQREGEIFLYIMEGELSIKMNDTEDALKKGDSLHIDSRIPHHAINQSNHDVTLLYVGTPSLMKNN